MHLGNLLTLVEADVTHDGYADFSFFVQSVGSDIQESDFLL